MILVIYFIYSIELPKDILTIYEPLLTKQPTITLQEFIEKSNKIFDKLPINKRNALFSFARSKSRLNNSKSVEHFRFTVYRWYNLQPRIGTRKKLTDNIKKMGIYEKMIKLEQAKEKKLEVERAKKRDKELENCTFKPKISELSGSGIDRSGVLKSLIDQVNFPKKSSEIDESISNFEEPQ